MKCLVVAAIAALGFVGAASAADMAVKAPPAPAIAPYSWTGIYIGGLASDDRADAQHCTVATGCLPAFPQTNMKGWEGGVTLGANYQLNHVVFGVEGDLSGGKVSGSSPSTGAFGCSGTCDNKISSVATLRGRLGYAWNQFMVYATAGTASERLQASLGTPPLVSSTATRSEFVWGLGGEAGFYKNWSAKIEYLQTSNIGTFAYDTNNTCGGAVCTLQTKQLRMLRFGVNWRFYPM